MLDVYVSYTRRIIIHKWINWVLLCVSIVGAMCAAEIALRVFIPEIGWAQRKEAIIGWSSDEYKQFDPSGKKGEGEKRILFVGDSFLAGSGVSALDRRFPIVLQSLLAPHLNVSVRILAAGGWGTDQELLAFKHKGSAWDADVVVIAFCAMNDISNIVAYQNLQYKQKPYFVIVPDGTLEFYNKYGEPRNYDTLFHNVNVSGPEEGFPLRSYLYDYLRYVIRYRTYLVDSMRFMMQMSGREDPEAKYRATKIVDSRYRQFRPWAENLEELYRREHALSWSPQAGVNHVSAFIHDDFEMNTYQWQLLERILAKFKREVEQAGGSLVLMVLPVIFNPRDVTTIVGGSFVQEFKTPAGSFTFRSDEPSTRLDAICARTGITLFDPTPDFIERVTQEGLMQDVWPQPPDTHFSDFGHELVAELAKEYFLELN